MRTIQAVRNGGYGLGIRSHVDVIRALSRGCGSTAWVVGVVQAHSWLISHFPETGQDEIYTNPDAMVSGGHWTTRSCGEDRRWIHPEWRVAVRVGL